MKDAGVTCVKTTCAYCGVGCGISAEVTGPRSVTIAGDPAHPANRGSLCSKGTHLGETVGLEGRLLTPMIGEKSASWNDATADVANRMRQCIDEHGPDSVAFYVSGQLLTEDYYIANKLMKGFVGSGNIDTNSRLCMASAVAAHNRSFGEDIVPCSYDDLDVADLILLVGSNTAWCHPVIWQRIEQARNNRGTKLVVIDPRRTETAERADLHIPIAPDGDTALFDALLAEMNSRGMVDRASAEAACNVPENFWTTRCSEHGIDQQLFEQLLGMVANNRRMITLFSQGANQSVGGTDKCNAIINLHLATGQINKPGSGPFSITGQPNAMGGREVGGLANMLACHLGFSEAERDDVAGFWDTDRLCLGPGLKAVDLFKSVHSGDVKFLWVMATNPAVSMPDAGFVREALAKCPNVIVSDVMADTDTGRFADVRLPACAWGEKDGTVTNSERYISRQRALFPAPGLARADWRIMCDVAAAAGFGDAFKFANSAAVFRQYAAMTALARKHGKQLDLTEWADCSDSDFDSMQPFQWGGHHPLGRGASTSDGRPNLIAVSPVQNNQPKSKFPMRLNTGRYRDQWHTMTRTGLSAKLSIHRREPLVEMHPQDAQNLGLQDDTLALVTTPYGDSVFRVRHDDGVQRGGLFVPLHWTDVTSGGGRTGMLAQSRTDPISGQPGFKDTPAKIEPLEPEWRAFLISREMVDPQTIYWSRARLEGAWLTEIAGQGSCGVDRLLPHGQRLEVTDAKRGLTRIVIVDDTGALLAALFLTRSGQLPGRDWIESQFSSQDGTPAEWLAGRPSVPAPNQGAIVCVCHNIGERKLWQAIDEGAGDVAAIGACTQAGTNCGSCRPMIARMLNEIQVKEAAE